MITAGCKEGNEAKNETKMACVTNIFGITTFLRNSIHVSTKMKIHLMKALIQEMKKRQSGS